MTSPAKCPSPLAQKIREFEKIIAQSDASAGDRARMIGYIRFVIVEAAKVTHDTCPDDGGDHCASTYAAILAAWDEAHREPNP